jgi:hypothetical protein
MWDLSQQREELCQILKSLDDDSKDGGVICQNGCRAEVSMCRYNDNKNSARDQFGSKRKQARAANIGQSEEVTNSNECSLTTMGRGCPTLKPRCPTTCLTDLCLASSSSYTPTTRHFYKQRLHAPNQFQLHIFPRRSGHSFAQSRMRKGVRHGYR